MNKPHRDRLAIAPIADVLRAATANGPMAYDCDAYMEPPTQDQHGIWHANVRHDPTCPWLNGTT